MEDLDKKSRESIVKDIDTNYFVEASAGSGKTTSLVYRMVKLVEEGKPVDKICTITFTRAAANEFFERFQKLLSIRSGDQPDSSDDLLGERTNITKGYCREALKNIDLCFLGTIDSFCNMVAHELPAELSIPSNSEVISREEQDYLLKEEFNNILKDGKHHLHSLALLFAKCFHKAYDAFSIGVTIFNDIRNLKVEYDETPSNTDFDEYYGEYKDDILDIINKFSKCDPVSLFGEENPAKPNKTRLERIEHLENVKLKQYYLKKDKSNWVDHIEDLKYLFSDINKMDLFVPESVDTDISSYLIAKDEKCKSYIYSEEFKEQIKIYSDALENYRYSVYFHFALSLLNEVVEKLKKKGKFQYFDFLLYLRDAFRKSLLGDKALIEHIYERHSYFLLDESQDTNPLQTETFFYLTASNVDEDWRKLTPKPGSLFIVGDPKQSIYSFRGADVKAYLANKKIFADKGEVLMLTRNYRSHASLRKWFNEAFDEMLNYEDDELKKYALEHLNIPIDEDDITLDIDDDDHNILDGVYQCPVLVDQKHNGFDEIAELIMDFIKNKKIYRVGFDKEKGIKTKKLDSIHYSDFLIVPIATKVDKIISSLNEYHIPMIVEAKIPFDSAETFNETLNLLYLFVENSNISHFIRVLQGKLFSYSDEDIIEMINDGFDLDISHEFTFSNSRHQQDIDILHKLYLSNIGKSFSSIMIDILNNKALNVFDKLSSKDLEYTFYLIEKIKEKEESGSLSSLSELKDYIPTFLSNRDDQRSLRFSKDVDRVKIANLHKVKGLQSPIVLLVSPKGRNRELVKYIDYEVEPPIVRFSKIEDPDNFNTSITSTNRYDDEKPMWEAYAKAESDRLAYVGATRAEAALVIFKDSKEGKEGCWDELTNRIDSDRVIQADSNILPEEEHPVEVSLGNFNIDESCHCQSTKYITPSDFRVSSSTSNEDDMVEKEEKVDATLQGTMVHKLMESIISSKNQYSDYDLLLESIISSYGADSSYKGMLQNVLNHILHGGFKQYNGTVQDDILDLLLNSKEVYCEVPFSYLSKSGNVVSGVIDVLYLDKDDHYHVIDYKTNSDDDVATLEKEYEGQLNHYRFALEKAGIKADAHIYHIKLM